jgi:hypothetical protein
VLKPEWVHRPVEHGGIVPEDGLRPVAVVSIDVDDGDALEAVRP